MIRALGYCIAFCVMFAILFLACWMFIAVAIAAFSFITWSLPAYFMVNLVVLRMFVFIAATFASVYCLSREAREAVDEFERSFKRSYND